MKRRIRGLFFILFVAGFLITAPLVVLHTAGYRVNLRTGNIVKTGALSVKSFPRNASVFVDGERLRERTPAVSDDILPGERVIRVEKPEYTSWEKTLPVVSQETTFVPQAVLYLEREPQRLLDRPLADAAVHAPSNRILYRRIQGQWSEVWLHEPGSDDERLLARVPGDSASAFTAEWNRDGTAVAIESGQGESMSLVVRDIAGGHTASVPDLLPAARRWFWDAGNAERLFVRTPDGLYAVDPQTEAVELLSRNAHAALMRNEAAYLVQNVDDRAIVTRERADDRDIIAHLPLGQYAFAPAPDGLLHLSSEKGALVLLDASGGNQPILLNTSASAARWHPDGSRRLLYTDGFGLHIYDAGSFADETLTRVSTPITGTAWHPRAGAAFYLQDGAIRALELDLRDSRETVKLVQGERIDRFWLDDAGKSLYFIGRMDGAEGLFERELAK